ncbi:hypothetical protein [Dyadobacter frigoris]|uniref:Uncharacterized protein n=1 Tax=Dyadobacter frigoris TaxID=2576211 RepID=A0A4U6D601_9BACT|nr:hypothetical protein [Dyadobacter frigoris]TKT91498.1 hypothetical protein FDK13_14085 [Dyadobacter frigoris]GLU51945.1 hypothetical protein Dfri01_14060 [Dyadobacter frigoris]
MKKYLTWAKLVLLISLYGCSGEKRNDVNPVRTMTSEFEEDTEGWIGDYALYNRIDTTKIAFLMERDSLPAAIDSLKFSLRMEATNSGDSIFLFIKKKIVGLNPEKTYNVSFDINIGTDYPDLAKATGTIISLKAGASSTEPVKILNGGYYNVSIKKGLWNVDGSEMAILGDITNGIGRTTYQLVNRNSSSKNISVKPDANGVIWVCVGEDTRYDKKTVLYFDNIKVVLTEQ